MQSHLELERINFLLFIPLISDEEECTDAEKCKEYGRDNGKIKQWMEDYYFIILRLTPIINSPHKIDGIGHRCNSG